MIYRFNLGCNCHSHSAAVTNSRYIVTLRRLWVDLDYSWLLLRVRLCHLNLFVAATLISGRLNCLSLGRILTNHAPWISLIAMNGRGLYLSGLLVHLNWVLIAQLLDVIVDIYHHNLNWSLLLLVSRWWRSNFRFLLDTNCLLFNLDLLAACRFDGHFNLLRALATLNRHIFVLVGVLLSFVLVLTNLLLLRCLTFVTTGSFHARFFAGSHDYLTIVSIAWLPMSPRQDTRSSSAWLLFAAFKGLFVGLGICRWLAAVYLLTWKAEHYNQV